jgi:hypothetical protein
MAEPFMCASGCAHGQARYGDDRRNVVEYFAPNRFISSSIRHGITCVSRDNRFIDHTPLSAKSSSTFAKPVTVFPFRPQLPDDRMRNVMPRYALGGP